MPRNFCLSLVFVFAMYLLGVYEEPTKALHDTSLLTSTSLLCRQGVGVHLRVVSSLFAGGLVFFCVSLSCLCLAVSLLCFLRCDLRALFSYCVSLSFSLSSSSPSTFFFFPYPCGHFSNRKRDFQRTQAITHPYLRSLRPAHHVLIWDNF